MVEIMKVEMQSVLQQVQNRPQAAQNTQVLQKLQAKLKEKDLELVKLKDERDQLVQISNDLRAELNRMKRDVNFEQKGMNRYSSVKMFGLPDDSNMTMEQPIITEDKKEKDAPLEME